MHEEPRLSLFGPILFKAVYPILHLRIEWVSKHGRNRWKVDVPSTGKCDMSHSNSILLRTKAPPLTDSSMYMPQLLLLYRIVSFNRSECDEGRRRGRWASCGGKREELEVEGKEGEGRGKEGRSE